MKLVSLLTHSVAFFLGLIVSNFASNSTTDIELLQQNQKASQLVPYIANWRLRGSTTNESWPFSTDFINIPVHQPPAPILQLKQSIKVALYLGNISDITEACQGEFLLEFFDHPFVQKVTDHVFQSFNYLLQRLNLTRMLILWFGAHVVIEKVIFNAVFPFRMI